MSFVHVRRALISVSDKSYLEELARSLVSLGIEIVATGGTAARLAKSNIHFRTVESFTEEPEAFDGRIKTLCFKLQSAILFDRNNPKHAAQAKEHSIEPIDMVVCNFYPFEEAAQKSNNPSEMPAELIEEIDIGGPSMVRAAAKNFQNVLVVVNPEDYAQTIQELRVNSGAVSLATRQAMMVRAFEKVYFYDRAIYETFQQKELRYGENPHQKAFLVEQTQNQSFRWRLENESQVELSYNNILDADSAFQLLCDIKEIMPAGQGACVIVKHNNPCGAATASTAETAFLRAWEGDPVSSFGGVVALSTRLTIECAQLFEDRFIEVVLAPSFEPEALEFLKRKKKKLRLVAINQLASNRNLSRVDVEGGYLIQQRDQGLKEEYKTVTQTKMAAELKPLIGFGVATCKAIRSNAITIVRRLNDGGWQLVGMGSGQPNRVDAIRKLAVPKAQQVLSNAQEPGRLDQCILVSDAFFPFADNILEAHEAGIRNIVQPGGSIKDGEVIAACDQHELAMVFTGRRHFRH